MKPNDIIPTSPSRVIVIIRHTLRGQSNVVGKVTATAERQVRVSFAPNPASVEALDGVKEALAAAGMVLGPDEEDGSFLILGARLNPDPEIPEGLLDDEQVVQG